MLKIKRLYLYILQSFIPVFVMTFGICLFVVLMQFVWRYVQDLVGKGIDMLVLGELFFYAALTLVPMALPLSLLLASLMAFGNMGENLELLAIKASGVSLFKAMRPIIVFVVMLAVGLFFFQNNVMPKVQVKFRTLFLSIKQKSPELDIPEGTFYSDIEGYNLFVKTKDPNTKMLRGVVIYSTSGGLDNLAVIVSDSAKMRMGQHKDFLQFTLYSGIQYSNFKQGQTRQRAGGGREVPPYGRESFKTKEIVIPFDANFNRMDEASMSGSQLSKNISELSSGIDSMNQVLDSVSRADSEAILANFQMFRGNSGMTLNGESETASRDSMFADIAPIRPDTLLNMLSERDQRFILGTAISRTDAVRYSNLAFNQSDTIKKMRSYRVEWYQKFTISIVCLIFFFIGAPLGAIIRKGGLGMPVVVSVLFFIVYYVVSNVGYKMARDGVWDTWSGMFLSSFLLAPIGVFLTYKSMNDSALFNSEAYSGFFKKLLAKTEKRGLARKEVVIHTPDRTWVQAELVAITDEVRQILPKFASRPYISFWTKPDLERGLGDLALKVENVVNEMSNARDSRELQIVSDFPILTHFVLPDFRNGKIGTALAVLFPLGLPLYLWIRYRDRIVTKHLRKLMHQAETLETFWNEIES